MKTERNIISLLRKIKVTIAHYTFTLLLIGTGQPFQPQLNTQTMIKPQISPNQINTQLQSQLTCVPTIINQTLALPLHFHHIKNISDKKTKKITKSQIKTTNSSNKSYETHNCEANQSKSLACNTRTNTRNQGSILKIDKRSRGIIGILGLDRHTVGGSIRGRESEKMMSEIQRNARFRRERERESTRAKAGALFGWDEWLYWLLLASAFSSSVCVVVI